MNPLAAFLVFVVGTLVLAWLVGLIQGALLDDDEFADEDVAWFEGERPRPSSRYWQ